MKKTLLSFAVLLLAATASMAQCDKRVTYTSDKQEMISPEGDVVNNKTDALTIEFTKENITINVGEKAGAMTASIKETTCQWKEIYKEGKLQILVEMARLDGKKIRVLVNKYEEK